MPIIKLADSPARPWKNGLGRTRELAIHPSTATMEDFQWRVSIAEVESAAPFSAFPGIDRVIALLDGKGFTMKMEDGRHHPLTAPCVPFAFAGETGVEVTLAGGPSRDFNLMLRRGRVRGGIETWRSAGTRQPDASIALVYCAQGTIDTDEGLLHVGDTWRPGSGALVLQEGALALAVYVELHP